jgi:hypothetical protein
MTGTIFERAAEAAFLMDPHAARLQASYVERFALLLAAQTPGQPTVALEQRLALSAVFGALDAAWSTWVTNTSADLPRLVDLAHDILDAGLRRTFTKGPAPGDDSPE